MATGGVTDAALVALAREAGLSVNWTDATGRKQTVSSETLRAVLAALGLCANTTAAIRNCRRHLMMERRARPKMIVTTAGEAVRLAAKSPRAELTLEDGTKVPIHLRRGGNDAGIFKAPHTPGYHHLEVDGHEHVLAIAPRRAYQGDGAGHRLWGIALQHYALHGGVTSGFGDFSALAAFAKRTARAGANAVAIGPIHAGLPGPVEHYSPYSPSSRYALNPLFAAVRSGSDGLERRALISWHAASEDKLEALDRVYGDFLRNSRRRKAFDAFVSAGGVRLLAHARFEALHARFAASRRTDWRRWPVSFRDASSADATRLGRSDRELELHLFRQWVADRDLASAHKSARDTGMAVGIIADLAVGLDPRGSHAWSAPNELLSGLFIGAPPDALGPDGQDWGLTTLSPFAMRADGYGSYIATLRSTMRHAGGIRIDHAMGLMRLWTIPAGAPSSMGVYLSYPFEDLLRLLMLESVRSRTLVIAEDLGTVPAGFRERITRAGLLGMRVLFFEREKDGSFRRPSKWDTQACALSTTHDLPTLAGWWRERDLDWRTRISTRFDAKAARHAREKDRGHLWRAMKRSHCADGPEPHPREEQVAVDAAIAFVGKAASKLAIVPLEDLVGEIEQPNFPGTVGEHPNWRRRLPPHNGLARPRAKRRLAILADERPAS